MGLLNWIRRLLGGTEEGLIRKFDGEGICPYCGCQLRSTAALQCFECGADWHNPNRVVRYQPQTKPQPSVIRQPARPPAAPKLPTPVEPIPIATPVTQPSEKSTVAETPASKPTAPAAKKEPKPKRQPGDLSYLNAGDFTPLTDAQVKDEAGELGSVWGNPWFGRRDVIPPTSDQRTLLIDRAMVAHGLLSPEELAEIHHVGEEMDKVRPDLALAQQKANEQVARSEEERERIKQQKKVEAAERKRKHAEAVAHRRATDIVFLGRGVSGGLHDRNADVAKLQQLNLPVLATPADVARALEIDIPRLRWLAFHSIAATRTHYISFDVPKKSGGTRTLSSPHRSLAACQQWMLRNVLDKVPAHNAAHGFIRGRSTVTGAREHVGRNLVLNADLEDFFPTITFKRIRGAFRQLGYSPAVATIFALMCSESPRQTVTYDGRTYQVATGDRCLPQGACTSPAISNLVSRRLDARLAGISQKLGWHYTRYADDLTFSAAHDASNQVGYLLARVRHITQDEGFRVNEKKTRLQGRQRAQLVTGVVVNVKPNVSRKTVRRLRAILHRAKTQGLPAQNIDGHPNFEAWIDGMISYVSMVNPDQGRPLREALNSLI